MTDYRAKAEEIERSNTPLANLYAAFAVYDLLKEVLDRLAPRPTPEPASVPPHLDSTCVCGYVTASRPSSHGRPQRTWTGAQAQDGLR